MVIVESLEVFFCELCYWLSKGRNEIICVSIKSEIWYYLRFEQVARFDHYQPTGSSTWRATEQRDVSLCH
jgi:hypothetical protein